MGIISKKDKGMAGTSGTTAQGFLREATEKKALTALSVEEFAHRLSSKEPTPGGGGAAAHAGALGAALGGMVANLTIGKPKYSDVED